MKFCLFIFLQAVNEHWWPIEARSAAFDHSFYTVAINRVGCEKFQLDSGSEKVFGPCFGSSYIATPDGSRTKVKKNTNQKSIKKCRINWISFIEFITCSRWNFIR